MPRPIFIDVHPDFNGPNYYPCTNEEPRMHTRHLKGLHFAKAGGISSAGEAMLGILLPHADEVFVADHCYRSLAAAFLKALMLDCLGAMAISHLFTRGTYADISNAISRVTPDVPEPMRGIIATYNTSYSNVIPDYSTDQLRNAWREIDIAALEQAHRRLGSLTIIHGDLLDLQQFGQLDLLYASNALMEQHSTRMGKVPDLAYVAPLVREDGLMLVARSNSCATMLDTDQWRRVANHRGGRTSYSYDLYQRETAGLLDT